MSVKNSPIKDAYQMSLSQDNPEGRNSWDQTAVLVAIKGYKPYFKIKLGTIQINDTTGTNQWIDDTAGKHAYLIKEMPEPEIAAIIENYMKHQPLKNKSMYIVDNYLLAIIFCFITMLCWGS